MAVGMRDHVFGVSSTIVLLGSLLNVVPLFGAWTFLANKLVLASAALAFGYKTSYTFGDQIRTAGALTWPSHPFD
jgi:hypothetical protein